MSSTANSLSAIQNAAVPAPAGAQRWLLSRLLDRFRRKRAAPALSAPAALQGDWLVIDSESDEAFANWLRGGEPPEFFRAVPPSCLGCHILVELFDCPREMLEREPHVALSMREAARRSKATEVASAFHAFNPCGVSGAVIIQESHYTIHTWPEYGYAAVDFFFCGDTVEVHRAVEVLRERFRPERMRFLVVGRGRKG